MELLPNYYSVTDIRIQSNMSKGTGVVNDNIISRSLSQVTIIFLPVGLSPLVNTAVYSKKFFSSSGRGNKVYSPISDRTWVHK